MNWADFAVIAAAALAIVSAALAQWASRVALACTTQVAATYQQWADARAAHAEYDRRSLACWLEINAAMTEDRPVADWAWAWAHGIDEDD